MDLKTCRAKCCLINLQAVSDSPKTSHTAAVSSRSSRTPLNTIESGNLDLPVNGLSANGLLSWISLNRFLNDGSCVSPASRNMVESGSESKALALPLASRTLSSTIVIPTPLEMRLMDSSQFLMASKCAVTNPESGDT